MQIKSLPHFQKKSLLKFAYLTWLFLKCYYKQNYVQIYRQKRSNYQYRRKYQIFPCYAKLESVLYFP